MLINVHSEITSQFHTDIEKMYWANDPTHLKWMEKRKILEKEFVYPLPSFQGMHLSDLNPHLWLTEKFNYDEYPSYVELPKRDKRNRKLNKMLGQGYSKFWQYPFEDYKKLSVEEQIEIRKESKTKFNFNSYGVCDSPEQLATFIKFLENLDKKYAVFICNIDKKDQPSNGGWRWHKWGQYIGKQKPTSEYLYDEPLINRVFIFNIYEITEKDSFSTSLFNYYLEDNSLIIYDKEDNFICNIQNSTNKEGIKACYAGRTNSEGFKPWLIYSKHYQENIENIISDVETIYLQYLTDGTLPSII